MKSHVLPHWYGLFYSNDKTKFLTIKKQKELITVVPGGCL